MRTQITRTEAKLLGLKRYFTGVKCKAGHLSERLVSTKACVECDLERVKEWKKKNKEQVKVYGQSRYAAKKSEILEQQVEYRAKNKIKIKSYCRKNAKLRAVNAKRWRSGNQERAASYLTAYQSAKRHLVNAKEGRRRAAKLMATPSWADHGAIKSIYERASKLESIDGIKRHVDHIVPLQGDDVCGLHVHWNLQILTATENLSKSNRHATG